MDVFGFRVEEFAKSALRDEFPPLENVVKIAVVLRHHVDVARALLRGNDGRAFIQGVGHGLLAEHVLATLQGGNGLRRVKLDGCRNHDDIQGCVHEVVECGKEPVVAQTVVGGHLREGLFLQVAERGNFNARMCGQGAHETAAPAQSDKANLQFVHEHSFQQLR